MSKESILSKKEELVALSDALKNQQIDIEKDEKEKANREAAIQTLKSNRPGSLRIDGAEAEFKEFVEELENKKLKAEETEKQISEKNAELQEEIKKELSNYKSKEELAEMKKKLDQKKDKIELNQGSIKLIEKEIERLQLEKKEIALAIANGKAGSTQRINEIDEKIEHDKERIETLNKEIKDYEEELKELEQYKVYEDNATDYAKLEDNLYELQAGNIEEIRKEIEEDLKRKAEEEAKAEAEAKAKAKVESHANGDSNQKAPEKTRTETDDYDYDDDEVLFPYKPGQGKRMRLHTSIVSVEHVPETRTEAELNEEDDDIYRLDPIFDNDLVEEADAVTVEEDEAAEYFERVIFNNGKGEEAKAESKTEPEPKVDNDYDIIVEEDDDIDILDSIFDNDLVEEADAVTVEEDEKDEVAEYFERVIFNNGKGEESKTESKTEPEPKVDNDYDIIVEEDDDYKYIEDSIFDNGKGEESKAEPKTEPKAETKPESKTESKAEPKTETKPKPEPKVGEKADDDIIEIDLENKDVEQMKKIIAKLNKIKYPDSEKWQSLPDYKFTENVEKIIKKHFDKSYSIGSEVLSVFCDIYNLDSWLNIRRVIRNEKGFNEAHDYLLKIDSGVHEEELNELFERIAAGEFDKKIEKKPEIKSESKAEAKTESKTEPKPQPKTESKADDDFDIIVEEDDDYKYIEDSIFDNGKGEESKAEPKTEPKAETKPESKTESKAEPKPQPKTESKADDDFDIIVEEDDDYKYIEDSIFDNGKGEESKAEPKTEPKAETKPESKTESKAEPKTETKPKPEPKTESKAEPKPESKTESKAESKTEPDDNIEVEEVADDEVVGLKRVTKKGLMEKFKESKFANFFKGLFGKIKNIASKIKNKFSKTSNEEEISENNSKVEHISKEKMKEIDSIKKLRERVLADFDGKGEDKKVEFDDEIEKKIADAIKGPQATYQSWLYNSVMHHDSDIIDHKTSGQERVLSSVFESVYGINTEAIKDFGDRILDEKKCERILKNISKNRYEKLENPVTQSETNDNFIPHVDIDFSNKKSSNSGEKVNNKEDREEVR